MMHREVFDWFGKRLSIETGRLAKQAHGAALVSLEDTVVLVTAVAAATAREGTDFVPLTVEYMERTYSAGRIPGGYFKREGRPTEVEILNSRLIDRPIRPLFPKGWRYETQVIALVLSADKENDPGIPAMIGASAALMLSDIPFEGPIAGLRVGRLDGQFVVNPTYGEREECDLDLAVAVGPQGLTMVEGGAKFVSEKAMVDALLFAEKAAQPVLEMQRRLQAVAGKPKRSAPVAPKDEVLGAEVRRLAWDPMCQALSIREKHPRHEAVTKVLEDTRAALAERFPGREAEIADAVGALERERLRGMIVEEGRRLDGRDLVTVRPISCEVGVLPRTHGSALFTRGETQVIVSVTLGTSEDEQRMDLLRGEFFRSFMLHYNFPPFSVGEVKRLGGPSRRDTGHGHLAERGVQAVLPAKDQGFPYTIRVVSEVLESNGSSSMATVCGASMALMDAGVPIRCHVGGVAMGLIKEGDRVAVLTDILGDEDHLGDMDFKVVGTREGITSVQMDIKVDGLDESILTRALEQARLGRLHILDHLERAIAKPRDDYSPNAPRIHLMKIKTDRIRDLIGPGGRNIRQCQADSGARIEVEDDGTVTIAATSAESMNKAIALVKGLTDDAEVGQTYLGEVVKVTDFGAFVRILPGVEGLVHISELSSQRVKRVEDVVREGDEVLVKCIGIDPKSGKIRLSRREAMEDRAAADQGHGEAGDPQE
ncbi:MAG TPA: polyribonucleotide nucleotidyltransferase [Myxococcota bacterium]|nr:polyribonucleotide nucleotidyltransferase [Myxococcota bacterium]HQK50832.1 polyribonucleotide nucleotidyltransferase [Myxococcota bacterium]